MRDSLWHRFGFWLERFTVLHGLLFREFAEVFYENRINGHLRRKDQP